MILSRAPVTQRLHSLSISVSARAKFRPHRVLQYLDRYITCDKLKIKAICPYPNPLSLIIARNE